MSISSVIRNADFLHAKKCERLTKKKTENKIYEEGLKDFLFRFTAAFLMISVSVFFTAIFVLF